MNFEIMYCMGLALLGIGYTTYTICSLSDKIRELKKEICDLQKEIEKR